MIVLALTAAGLANVVQSNGGLGGQRGKCRVTDPVPLDHLPTTANAPKYAHLAHPHKNEKQKGIAAVSEM